MAFASLAQRRGQFLAALPVNHPRLSAHNIVDYPWAMTFAMTIQYVLRRIFTLSVVLAFVFGIALAVTWHEEEMYVEDIFEWGGITLFIYSWFAVPIFGAIWFLSRKRVRWTFSEVLLLLLPWAVHFLLSISPLEGLTASKSLSNGLGEPFFLGAFAGLAPLPKVLLGHRTSYRNAVLLGTSLAVGAAILIFFFTPSLSE